jgi:hypothetical protein
MELRNVQQPGLRKEILIFRKFITGPYQGKNITQIDHNSWITIQ